MSRSPIGRHALLAAALLLSGCARRPPGDVLAGVQFDGNTRPTGLDGVLPPNTDSGLRHAMQHPQPRRFSTWVPGLVPPTPLDKRLLDEDAWRIEVWYADHGWFDARFLGWELRRAPQRWPWAGMRPWIATGHVAQGEPSRIRTVAVTGTDELTAPLRARLREVITLAPGDPYDALAWQEGRDALIGILRDRGYAYARVEPRVDARPDEHVVDVTFQVLAGPACKFGPVEIASVEGVPADAIRDAVPIRTGQGYRASVLAATREQLFALRAFSVVNVEPDLSAPETGIVPVRITLRAGRTRSVAFGPEVDTQTGKAALQLSGAWASDNTLRRLWRTAFEARAGVASILTVDEAGEDTWGSPQPVGEASLSATLPRVPAPGWTASATARAEVDVEPGYSFFSPELNPAVSWKPNRAVTVSLGHRLRYFALGEASVDLSEIVDAPRGIDPNEPYFLSILDQSLVYDGRNDPIRTTRGTLWSLKVAEAGGPLGGTYGFLRATGEWRGYHSVTRLFGRDPDLVLAGRVAGGGILPAQGDDVLAIPVQERLYLGGGTTVRGWAADRLGPWEEVTNAAGVAEIVPIGAIASLSANAEARKALGYDVSAAGFVDVGRTWRTFADVGLASMQVSLGGGLRYDSLIGPVRIDLARRMGDDPAFALYPRWAVHFGLSEAF